MGNAAAIRRFSSRRQKGRPIAAGGVSAGGVADEADGGVAAAATNVQDEVRCDRADVRCSRCSLARTIPTGTVAFTCKCGMHVRVPLAAMARNAKAEATETLRRAEVVMQVALNDQEALCGRLWADVMCKFDNEESKSSRDFGVGVSRSRAHARDAIAARDSAAAAQALESYIALRLPFKVAVRLKQLLTQLKCEEQGVEIMRNLITAIADSDRDNLRKLCNAAATRGLCLPKELGSAVRALDSEERAVCVEREYQLKLQARVMEAHSQNDMEKLAALAAEVRLLGEDVSVVEAVLSLHAYGDACSHGREDKQPTAPTLPPMKVSSPVLRAPSYSSASCAPGRSEEGTLPRTASATPAVTMTQVGSNPPPRRTVSKASSFTAECFSPAAVAATNVILQPNSNGCTLNGNGAAARATLGRSRAASRSRSRERDFSPTQQQQAPNRERAASPPGKYVSESSLRQPPGDSSHAAWQRLDCGSVRVDNLPSVSSPSRSHTASPRRSKPFVAMVRAMGRASSRPVSARSERSSSNLDESGHERGRKSASAATAVAASSSASVSASAPAHASDHFAKDADAIPYNCVRSSSKPPPAPTNGRSQTPRSSQTSSTTKPPPSANHGIPVPLARSTFRAASSPQPPPAPGAAVTSPAGGGPAMFRPPRPSSAGSAAESSVSGPKPPPPPSSWCAGATRRPCTLPPSPGQQQDSQYAWCRPGSAGPCKTDQAQSSSAQQPAQHYRNRSNSVGPPRTEQSAAQDPGYFRPRPSSAGSSRSAPGQASEQPWYHQQPPPRPPPATSQRAAMTRHSALGCLGLKCIHGANPTIEEIRRAYKQAALKWHPDRQQNHGCAEEAKERFQEVRTAFEVLQACVRSPAAAAAGA